MDQLSEFVLHDVRCFHGEQRAHLQPITLLVGENSTGKTTFLGCYGVMHRLLAERNQYGERFDFNREPFSMGSFRDIVRSRRGRDGRIDEFKLGLTVPSSKDRSMPSYRLSVSWLEEGSQPVVSSVHYQFNRKSFLNLRRNNSGGTILTIPNGKASIHFPIDEWMLWLGYLEDFPREFSRKSPDLRLIIKYLTNYVFSKKTKASQRALSSWTHAMPQLLPIAPLRSKPKRTYDPIRETASPDGEHIPMLMMRLDRTDKGSWNSLHNDLVEFGRSSGLFSDINVRRHGKQMSDPFQLQVKVRSGSQANLVDVGYGVSQSLPILVDVRFEKNRTFLLQQPEVHLHPRAQAELAALFVESFKKNGNRFLIETHSDYIIDRVRILVRQGRLNADDVSILYFEPTGNAVSIHSMALDDNGNLTNAPKGYRSFFITETDRLLGFEN